MFNKVLIYQRFNEISKKIIIPLSIFFKTIRAKSEGIAFVDSTSIKVCHNKRISQHKCFKSIAKRSKTSMNWFYDFKVHLMINHNAEMIDFCFTAGNVHDTQVIEYVVRDISRKLYADKGYLSKKLTKILSTSEKNIQLITNVRKNMKSIALSRWDKIMLKKRSIIETVFGRLKTEKCMEHSRHRSIYGLIKNSLGSIISYN